jgi:DNA-binding XRE family transcriptional regulator
MLSACSSGHLTLTPALPLFGLVIRSPKPLDRAYPTELRSIGDHVRKRRLDLGLLQRDVALRIGVDKTTVFNWEAGSGTGQRDDRNWLVIRGVGETREMPLDGFGTERTSRGPMGCVPADLEDQRIRESTAEAGLDPAEGYSDFAADSLANPVDSSAGVESSDGQAGGRPVRLRWWRDSHRLVVTGWYPPDLAKQTPEAADGLVSSFLAGPAAPELAHHLRRCRRRG